MLTRSGYQVKNPRKDGGNELRWRRLMVAAHSGDKESYHLLLGELSEFIKNYLRKNFLQSHLVEDISQEVLISIHRARHTYNPERPILPWLIAIIRYRTIDELRKLSRSSKREIVDTAFLFELGETNGKEETYLDQELSEEILRALKSLPHKQRNVLELLKLKGMSVKEVSATTGFSESSVKVSAHRAYKTLRKRLKGLTP